jgi:hypothetical protein
MPILVDEAGTYWGRDGDPASWAVMSSDSTWVMMSDGEAIDGAVLATSVDGAAVTFSPVAPQPQSVGVVATVGPWSGAVEVYVDGRFRKTIDLSSPVVRERVVVGSVRLRGTTTQSLTLVARTSGGVPGTAGKSVNVDGLIVV